MLALKTLGVDRRARARRSSSTRSTPASAARRRRRRRAGCSGSAERFQVLCITHLPQIAACGATQFRIESGAAGAGPYARRRASTATAREEEIARMIGGAERHGPCRRVPRELLRRAARRAESAASGERRKRKAKGESESRRRWRRNTYRNVRLPDERPRLGAHGRSARPGRLRADGRRSRCRRHRHQHCSVREHAEEKLFTRLGEICAC